MDGLLQLRAPMIRQYYLAASTEEAIAYLSAHAGDAQVLGGGTTLLPLVLRGKALATYLVDVSRVASMRRIRLEPSHLLLGGAVTLAQMLRSESLPESLAVLKDSAEIAPLSRLHSLATLAGSIVSAYGTSEIAATLIALGAEAEIANLTGSQWLPVGGLLSRPGTCRLNSMSEILVSLRIRLPQPGEGAGIAQADTSEGAPGGAPVIAISLSFDEIQNLLSRITVVLGLHGAAPQVSRLDELADGRTATVDTMRRSIAQWATARMIDVTEEAPDRARAVAGAAQRALEVALTRARASLANGML